MPLLDIPIEKNIPLPGTHNAIYGYKVEFEKMLLKMVEGDSYPLGNIPIAYNTLRKYASDLTSYINKNYAKDRYWSFRSAPNARCFCIKTPPRIRHDNQ